MKRLELLIEEARELSGNERYDADSGISQAVFVRYFKNAQDSLQKALAIAKTKLLLVEKTIPVVNSQESYPYPDDLFLQNIDTIEWSDSGFDGWTPLRKCLLKDRRSSATGYAYGYITRKDDFLLTPPLTSGTLRLNYIKKLPALEKRAGKISAVTVSGGEITALTIDSTEDSFDAAALNKHLVLCVVDKNGERKVKGVEFSSVNSSNGVFTLGTNHALDVGESVSTGDFVVCGEDSYNRCSLDDISESYLLKYAVYEAKYGDKSKWTAEAVQDMTMSLSTLIESFSRPSDDVIEIPVTNLDFMGIG
jgi:hypothetical protein